MRLSDESRGYKDSVGYALTTGKYASPIVKKNKSSFAKKKALESKISVDSGKGMGRGLSHISGKTYKH